MRTIGDSLPDFRVVGVKPGFNDIVSEKGESAFEDITNTSFAGKWKVIYFYPKDFTFVCPTEIVEFSNIAAEFEKRNAVLLGGSSDNEFCKLAWRREHPQLSKLNHYMFADCNGSLIDGLGIRDITAGVALRATFIVDPENVIQMVSVYPLAVGRNPSEVLRALDSIQTGELSGCNRAIGGATIKS